MADAKKKTDSPKKPDTQSESRTNAKPREKPVLPEVNPALRDSASKAEDHQQ